MDWPNTDCARSSYILRCLATSARKLALEQMRAPEPLGRARRVHVLTRDAHEVRFAVVVSVALEWPQLGADLDRRPEGRVLRKPLVSNVAPGSGEAVLVARRHLRGVREGRRGRCAVRGGGACAESI